MSISVFLNVVILDKYIELDYIASLDFLLFDITLV
jgi:hypothetical protein